MQASIRRSWRGRPRRVAALVLAAGLLLASCSAADDALTSVTMGQTASDAPGDDGGADRAVGEAAAEESLAAPKAGTADDAFFTVTAPGIGAASVIREADIRLQVENFDAAWDEVRRLAAGLGGYVGNASTGVEVADEDTRYAFGTVTLRIPADRFDEALDRIEALGTPTSSSITGIDVGEEYVDLQARLSHWQAVEASTLKLLERAETIEESLRVQQQLNEIQLTVERLEGRLRYLDNRTALSTVTVSMTEAPAVAPAPPLPSEPSPIAEAFAQATEVILSAVGFMIVAAAFALPFAIVALLGLGAYRLSRRLNRRAPAATTPEA